MSAQIATGGVHPSVHAELVEAATRIWRERSALAARKWPGPEAEQRLRPWLAMALLADVPADALPREIAEEIDSMCRCIVFCAGKGAPIERDKIVPDDNFARAILAFGLSTYELIERELGEATNRAADRHAANPTGATLATWRDLAALSRALGVIVPWRETPAHSEPAEGSERKAA